MPKIRGIKPEFWTDEDIVDLTPLARLLYIGLWNYACDNGHLEDRPKQLKMRLLPADECSVAGLLRELAEKGRITRSEGWITVPNLSDHQRIDKRFFTTCDMPDCSRPDPENPNPKRKTRRAPDETTTGTRGDHACTPGDCDCDVDGDGELSRNATPRKRATQIPETWAPNEQHTAFAASEGLTLGREADRFRDHHKAKGSTYKDWDASFRNWLRNAVEYGRGKPKLTSVPRNPDGSLDESGLPPVEDSWMKRRPTS